MRKLSVFVMFSCVFPYAAIQQPSLPFGPGQITLRFAAHPERTFTNFSSIAVPWVEVPKLEIFLQNALSEIEISSVRVLLNGRPVSVFAKAFPAPRGVKVILGLDATRGRDYRLSESGQNFLEFQARDQLGNAYHGQFVLSVAPLIDVPQKSTEEPSKAPSALQARPRHQAPVIEWEGAATSVVRRKVIWIEAEISDQSGLRRVVIEVNGKDVEVIELYNGLPMRTRQTFFAFAAKGLPGAVTGDGHRLRISVPVKIGRRMNKITLRAENTLGLTGVQSRTVVREKR